LISGLRKEVTVTKIGQLVLKVPEKGRARDDCPGVVGYGGAGYVDRLLIDVVLTTL